jgi:hypothetical protein
MAIIWIPTYSTLCSTHDNLQDDKPAAIGFLETNPENHSCETGESQLNMQSAGSHEYYSKSELA